MLIKQNDSVLWLQLFQDEFTFLLLLLILSQAFCVLQLRNGQQFERHIVAYTLYVVIDGGLEMLVRGLANE